MKLFIKIWLVIALIFITIFLGALGVAAFVSMMESYNMYVRYAINTFIAITVTTLPFYWGCKAS